MKAFLFLGLLLTATSSFGSDFTAFQKILERGLAESQLPGGGIESSFNYQRHAKDETLMSHIDKQKTKLKKFDVSNLKTKEENLAFWINAYNFFMIVIVLEQGFEDGKLKIDSVKDFGNFFNPYKIFKKEINNIGGKKYSLDQIEKKTLLGEEFKKKGWKDARIHFAVNCASVGCPPLRDKIYKAETINRVLDQNIRLALKTPRHFKNEGGNIHLTHLFKWYNDDFIEYSGSIKKFLLKYLESADMIKVVDGIKKDSQFIFIDYDWRLNQPKNFK